MHELWLGSKVSTLDICEYGRKLYLCLFDIHCIKPVRYEPVHLHSGCYGAANVHWPPQQEFNIKQPFNCNIKYLSPSLHWWSCLFLFNLVYSYKSLSRYSSNSNRKNTVESAVWGYLACTSSYSRPGFFAINVTFSWTLYLDIKNINLES